MFLCKYMFACACLYSLRVANRLWSVPELWGSDDQDLVNHWSRDQALRVLQSWRPWASVWWRQVSSDLLCPIYFIIHSFAYHDQLKVLTSFLFTMSLITFWVIMVSFMLLLYFNQWTWWEYLWYDDNILIMMMNLWYLRGLGLFPEYLSVRICSLDDHLGK